MSTTAAPWTIWPQYRATLGQRPIVVLYGGDSAEREVSLVSGRAVLEALSKPAGSTADLAPEVHPHELVRGGLTPDVERFPKDAVYLLALHGGAGEDGRIQAALELAGRAYTGARPSTSALCMDKGWTRTIVQSAGVTVADGLSLAPGAAPSHEDALAPLLARPGPWFVKDARGGSSIDLVRCTEPDAALHAAASMAARGLGVLVERAVLGVEISIGVVGEGRAAACLPVVEILPRGADYFDYREKYDTEGAIEHCPAELLAPELEERIRDRARAAWDAVRGEGYARIDFIVPSTAPDARPAPDAEPVMLEINTLPGFTPTSLLPREAATVGVDFRELCLELVARAIRREESR